MWFIEDDMECRPEQPRLPSGLVGTASARWGRSACGTRLWPACWTWGWSRRAEPPAPTQSRGCSHPDLKSWPLQPPYVQEERGETKDTEKKTVSGERDKIHQSTHTALRKSSADPQHKFRWKTQSCLCSADSGMTDAFMRLNKILHFRLIQYKYLLFGLVGLCCFSRVYLRAGQSNHHTEMDIHLSLRPQTSYNISLPVACPQTQLTHYSTVTCIFDSTLRNSKGRYM